MCGSAATRTDICKQPDATSAGESNTAITRAGARCATTPYIFDGYIEGTLLEMLANKTAAYLNKNVGNMSAEEAAVTAFLRLRLAADLTTGT